MTVEWLKLPCLRLAGRQKKPKRKCEIHEFTFILENREWSLNSFVYLTRFRVLITTVMILVIFIRTILGLSIPIILCKEETEVRKAFTGLFKQTYRYYLCPLSVILATSHFVQVRGL